ncbi:MAG: hypothetical protein IJC25_00390, partial [Clostridia bacterium]|nr:hypothetical protein [Clostridia bacterium]
IPCGTGNDFVKTVSSHAQMLQLERYITAPSRRIDCLAVGEHLCINICNIGVDANAAYYMQQVKRVPLLNGLSYYLGLGWAACHGLGTRMRVEFDDGEVADRRLAIAVCGNGRYYGGAFLATPEALVDDGLIDVCLINEINVFTFLRLVGKYKQGLHVHDPQFQKYITYRTAKSVTDSAPKAFRVSSDGEIIAGKSVTVRILPAKVRFLVPEEE